MRYWILALALLIADQGSKLAVRAWLAVGESVPVLGTLFRLTHVENTGAAFRMLSGQRVLLVLLPLAVGVAAVWYLCRHRDEHWSLYLTWTLILAGGLGNLIDRMLRGSVTDMLDLSFFPPVFNLADICVCVGCGGLALYLLFGERWSKK